MTKRHAVLLVLSAVVPALAGCVSPQELRARDEATCRGYGFNPGTTEFATCLQREQLARQYYWSAPYAYGPFPAYAPYGF
jgi:hypothetical protein